MLGEISKFFADKGFGFIKGSDENSYFFHLSHISSENKFDVSEGKFVEFSPSSNVKGFQANEIRQSSEFYVFWEKPGKFIFSKNSDVIKGKIQHQTPAIEFTSNSSPDDAKNLLIKQAANIGANGLTNLKYSKSTGSDGNYRYSIHHYSGTPVWVMIEKPTMDLEKANKSKLEVSEFTERLNNGYLKYEKWLKEQLENERKKREKIKRIFKRIVLSLIIFFIILMIFTH